jgi:hypothetical protein
VVVARSVMNLDVMACPQAPEPLTTSRQLTHELTKAGIVDLGTGQCPQARDGVVGDGVPVIAHEPAHLWIHEGGLHDVDAGG